MIDLNEIRVFVKVVETGSFAGAARSLALPSTTVSRRVQRLEKSLGMTLLRRSTRKLTLTEQGERYFNQCQKHISGLDDANIFAAQLQQQPRGTLKISAPLDFVVRYAQSWINEFLTAYPDVNIELDATDGYKDILEEKIDICFRSGEIKGNDLIARRIMSTQTIYCASPDYLERYGIPENPDELSLHTCVSWGQDNWLFQNERQKWDILVKGRYKTNSIHLAIRAAEAGLGIIKTPVSIAEPFLNKGSLQRILQRYEMPPGQMYIVYKANKYLPKAMRLFIDHVITTTKLK